MRNFETKLVSVNKKTFQNILEMYWIILYFAARFVIWLV